MHLSMVGQLGFGTKSGSRYATAPKGGGNVQRFTRKGHQAPSCPSGARSVSSGSYGTGAQTVSYRDCEMRAVPVAAPPPPPPAPVITVSPAIQTQVSPQISPTMVQQQASPGASVQAQPISTPGGQQAATAPTQDVERILEAERRAMAAEAAQEQAQRDAEVRELQRQYEQRAALEAQLRARDEAEARTASEAAATETAAAEATYIPPPAPTFAPTPMAPAPMAPAPMEPAAPPEEKGIMMPLLIAAAAAGGLYLMTRKKGRKR